jgi:hypothetical protein
MMLASDEVGLRFFSFFRKLKMKIINPVNPV